MAGRNHQTTTILVFVILLSQLLALPTNAFSLRPSPGSGLHSTALSIPLSQNGQPNQLAPPACLAPSPADFSKNILQPSTSTVSTSATIPGTVVSDVALGRAKLLAALQSSTVLHLSLVFKIRNQGAFNECLTSISDPSSPYYRHFLNATTLAPYVETPGEKASVLSYFAAQGVNVTEGPSPLVLQIRGSVANVQKVLNLHVNLYHSGNRTFYSADQDPSMPQNYAALVTTITGLNNYTTVKHLEIPCGPAPNMPYCSQAVEVGYSMSSLYSNGFNGKGVTIAVVDEPGDPNASLALSNYDTTYELQPPSSFQTLCGGETAWVACDSSIPYDSGWASEAAMDIESAHAMAPGASIMLFYGYYSNTDPLIDAIDYIASNHLASIVSNSWTYGVDTQLQIQLPGFVSGVDSRLALDAAQGLTIIFASGDSGADVGTYYPASDPNVLAVGATDLAMLGCGTSSCSSYGGEQGSVISGGGYSGVFAEPSWQTSSIGATPKGLGGHGRGVPDVSMIGFIPGFWVYASWSNQCGVAAPAAGWFGCSGTSLSTPLWAGFLAVALQVNGGGSFGNIGPTLYKLGASASYGSIFHDVTAGSNNGYSAGVGWDAVTGWGTPIGDKLAGAISSTPTIVTLAVSYSIIGGGTPSAPTFHYVQNGASKTVTLTNTPSAFVVDGNSSWSVTPNPLSGSSSSQRWEANPASLQGKASASASIVFTYYHQYLQTLSYSVSGGGSGYSAPTFTANEYGSGAPQLLTTTATGYWYDSGSSWSITNPLPGSTSSEQWWTTHAASGTITAAQTIAFSYQNQYYLTMGISPSGAGTTNPSSGWHNVGAVVSISASASPGDAFASWTGSGTGSYSGTSNAVSVTVKNALAETANFNSQVTMTVSYKTIGGGGGTAPVFHYIKGGLAKSYTLTTTATSISVDAGSFWSVTNNPLSGSSSSQRWISLQTLSGTATSSATIVFTFYHQYLQTLSYSVSGGGAGYSPPVFTATQFGVPVNQVLTSTPTASWFDGSSAWSVTNPLAGSTANERWHSSQATSGTITAATTRAFTYTHQFLLTIQVSASGGGSVTPSTGWYNVGQLVTIKATASSGHTFSSWTGSGTGNYTGTSVSATVAMKSAITETATFIVPPLTVTLTSPSNGGTVSSSPVKFSVHVTFISSVVSGATVSVDVDGNLACTGLTDSYGNASCSAVMTKTGGTHIWYATATKTGYQLGTSPTWTCKY